MKLSSIMIVFTLATSWQQTFAAVSPQDCVGGASLGSFRILVESPRNGRGDKDLPLSSVNALRAHQKLKYIPVELAPEVKEKAKITLLLVNGAEGDAGQVEVLDSHSADKSAEWVVPFDTSIIGVVFGPQGLDVKKVNSLVRKNHQLVTQLADYAEQTTQVGALVETLMAWEQAPTGHRSVEAALSGFFSRYGVGLPKLDPNAPADQQAALLLRAVLPSLGTYDPLTIDPSVKVQQSAGLAASVASLFFGTPVAVAAGGAVLFQNLRTLMFPDTDFRSAYVHFKVSETVALCSKRQPARSRTRTAYLWAIRLPGAVPPRLTLSENLHLPLGWKSVVRVSLEHPSQLKRLSRFREWQLKSDNGNESYLVSVTPSGTIPAALDLDLSQGSLPPGGYRLTGKWDWDPVPTQGLIHLHPFGELSKAQLTSASQDRLLAARGLVPVQLTGADFEFVEKLSLLKTNRRNGPAVDLWFALPLGKQAGPQSHLETEIDTEKLLPGPYQLQITQLNGQSETLPLTLHPAHPKIRNLPLRVNLGEDQQPVSLEGSDLERIEWIKAEGIEWEFLPQKILPGQAASSKRDGLLRLNQVFQKGEAIALSIKIEGINEPLQLPAGLTVAGPRPRIVAVNRSFPAESSASLRNGEIPGGFAVSFGIQAEQVESALSLDLTCSASGESSSLVLKPGDRRENAKLDLARDGLLFLSLDPGLFGFSGCKLSASVVTEAAGRSDPYVLGEVIRVPRIERFRLTEESVGKSSYLGILTGRELQTIEKAGWNPHQGFPVVGIPTPVPGETTKQTLKIALPWPSPSPRAPLYVWLRGETQGRATQVKEE